MPKTPWKRIHQECISLASFERENKWKQIFYDYYRTLKDECKTNEAARWVVSLIVLMGLAQGDKLRMQEAQLGLR